MKQNCLQVICIYHILNAGNLTGFVRSRSLLPGTLFSWDLGHGVFFKNTSCFALDFDI